MVEDAQLFREAQGGSSHAFGQLVRRHEAHVGAVVIARMRQTAQVDDVVQETFIAAWMRRDSLSDPEKFRAWICGIARNQAAKVRRRESRPVPILDTGMTDSVEDELLRAESERVLADSLSALPEEHREVIILYYREERSIREIATALRLSEAAAQKRISRARSSVKESVLARLGEALPATKSTAGASAAVLASITIGVAPATANASL